MLSKLTAPLVRGCLISSNKKSAKPLLTTLEQVRQMAVGRFLLIQPRTPVKLALSEYV